MRIVIGEIAHETNTFCPGPTTEDHFRARGWYSGEDVIARHRGIRTDIGGMIAAAEAGGHEVVPTLTTWAEPWGTISRDTYDRLLGELLAGLRAALDSGPVDAVCLALHGAGVADGIDDFEGALLTEVRATVGVAVPILVTLDLHGNLTQTMADEASVLLGCHFYPHVDMYERGIEAVQLAEQIRRGDFKPAASLVLPPMLISTSTTDISPARDINALCAGWEENPEIVDVTFFHGFPYTDIPRSGVAIIATAKNDPNLAREAATDVARGLWAKRQEFALEPNSPEDAIQQALAVEGRPVVINETADNPGGGAPGDATHLLRAMLDAGLAETCFGCMCDAETAAQAHEAGLGQTIDVQLGGKGGPLYGKTIEAKATVEALTDGKYIATSPMMTGVPWDLGPSARLKIDGIDVVVTTRRSQVFDPEIFRIHGIDVRQCKIVGLKSSQHFRAGFAPIAADIIRADTPGTTSIDLFALPFQRLEGPVWPLQSDTEWDPSQA